jgi:hypothetical protein
VAQHAACPVTVVHCGPPAEGRRNSIGASFRKGLEKISLLPGGKGALFGRSPSSNAAQPPGAPGTHAHGVAAGPVSVPVHRSAALGSMSGEFVETGLKQGHG